VQQTIDCPVTFTLKQGAGPSFDSNVFEIERSQDGLQWTAVVSLSTNDVSYDMVDLLMSITATTVMSTRPENQKTATAGWNVEMLHPCRNEELSPPVWE
jgi:hypothetical protein